MGYIILTEHDIYGQWDLLTKFLKMDQTLGTFMDLLTNIQITLLEERWPQVTKQFGRKMVLEQLQLVQISGLVDHIMLILQQ